MNEQIIDDILKWLPLFVSALNEGKKLVDNVTTSLKQNAELTPEQEKQLDAAIAQKEASDAWQEQD